MFFQNDQLSELIHDKMLSSSVLYWDWSTVLFFKIAHVS